MSNRRTLGEKPEIEFYWLREAWSAAWHTPISLGSEWPAEVPPQIRNEIETRLEETARTTLPPGRKLEVHLPYEFFRQPRAEGCEILMEPGGRVVVRYPSHQTWPETLNLYQVRLIVLSALHADRKSMMRLRARTPSGRYLELPARAFVRWKALPLPGRTAHSAIFSHVSLTVQKAFRRYFLEAYFDNIERFGEYTDAKFKPGHESECLPSGIGRLADSERDVDARDCD